MRIELRIGSKARKVGNSMTTTIPKAIVDNWNLKEGDQTVIYQIEGMMVVCPLAYLGMVGEPKLVRLLTAAPPLLSSKTP